MPWGKRSEGRRKKGRREYGYSKVINKIEASLYRRNFSSHTK
jgi:hypothetical protein